MEALESPAVSLAEASAAQTSDISDPSRDSAKGASGQGGQGGGTGQIMNAEQLNGRFAMMGVMGTTAFELLAGHPVVQMVGLR